MDIITKVLPGLLLSLAALGVVVFVIVRLGHGFEKLALRGYSESRLGRLLWIYTSLNGRISLGTYLLHNVLVLNVITITAILIDIKIAGTLGSFTVLSALIVFVPFITINVKRLHDRGKSGEYMLLLLVPLFGDIWYMILVLGFGDEGDNVYGPDPRVEDWARLGRDNPA